MPLFETEYRGSEADEAEFVKETQGLSPANQLDLQVALAKINEAATEYSDIDALIDPTRTEDGLNAIIPHLRRASNRFMNALRPFKSENETWDQALKKSWEAVIKSVQNESNQAFFAFRIAMGKARYLAGSLNPSEGDARWGPDWDVARAAGWEVVKGDHNPTFFGEDPYVALAALQKFRPSRMQFLEVKDHPDIASKQRLVMDFPLYVPCGATITERIRLESGTISACLSFGDPALNDPGDSITDYGHEWFSPCSDVARLSSLIPMRVPTRVIKSYQSTQLHS